MSDLLTFDDNEGDLFVPDEQTKSKKPAKNLDDFFGSSNTAATSANTLDDIFTAQLHDDMFKPQAKPQAKPQKKTESSKVDALFGTEEDDEFDFFSSNSKSPKSALSGNTKAKTEESRQLDSLDLLLDNASQSDSGVQSHRMSQDQSQNSLDMLLDAQPLGTVSASDDLMSIMDPGAKDSSQKPHNVEKENEADSKSKYRDEDQDSSLFGMDDLSDFTEKPGLPHDESQHSLDILLDAQPSGMIPDSDNLMSILDVQTEDDLSASNYQEAEQQNPKCLSEREQPLHSLDILLDAQPSGMIPASDNLMSILDVQTEDDLSASNYQEAEQQNPKCLSEREQPLHSLDILLDAQPSGTIPASDNLMSILDVQAEENIFTSKIQQEASQQKPKGLPEHDEPQQTDDDLFASNIQEAEQQKSKSLSEREQPLHSLDVLLDAQPSGTIPASDNLMPILDVQAEDDLFTPNTPQKAEQQNPKGLSEREQPLHSLDILLDAQPSGTIPASDNLMSILDVQAEDDLFTPNTPQKAEQQNPKGLSEREQPLHSLDILLDAQPSGTIPASDNLMSILDVQAEDDLFTPNTPKKAEQRKPKGLPEHDDPQQTDDDLFASNIQEAEQQKPKGLSECEQPLHSLDVLLDSQPSGTIPASDNLMSILDVQAEDDLFTPNIQQKAAQQQPKGLSELVDKTYTSAYDNSLSAIQSESKKQSHGASRDKSMDSLDMLLDDQPPGTVPASDDLMSIVDRAHTNNPAISSNNHTVAWDTNKDSLGETTDPVDDFFGTSDPREVNQSDDTEESRVTAPKKTNLKKRSMERSFEDLLTGLSDESEPELDDMIDDSCDNTNLESLLGTPNKSVTQPTIRSFQHSTPYSTVKPPDNTYRQKDSLLEEYDFGSLKSLEQSGRRTDDAPPLPSVKPPEDMDYPKDSLLDDYDFGSIKPEVKVHEPYDDEKTDSMDLKSWEMVDQDESGDRADVENSTEVVMRHRNDSQRSQPESTDIDLSAIEDTNHLDVDLNKHKSALGKKGSLALRRKPSRKSRRSLLSAGEDALFVDSTDPRPSGMVNGEEEDSEDGDDQEDLDLSPPAKKHSPSTMVQLPGFSFKPPPRLSASSPQDEEMEPPQEARRISKPPPGAFRLPPVMPRQTKPSTDYSPSLTPGKPSDRSSTFEFEKPALRAPKPNEGRAPEPESPVGFGTPQLKKVGEEVGRRRLGSEERDMRFEKPALRSTPKPGQDRGSEEKMDTNTGVFAKPQLRTTSTQQAERFTKPVDDKPVETFEPRMLRTTPKRETENKMDSDKHVFDKPRLRTTGKPLTLEQRQNSESDSNESAKTFEKPVLRSAKKDFRSDSFGDSSNDSTTHTFEKPLLKNNPNRPSVVNDNTKKEQFTTGVFEKPSLKKSTPSPEKEVKAIGEPKGLFDKPALRRTEGSKVAEQRGGKSAEKPSWLQAAAEKQTKVLDALQTKENRSVSSERETPSWLENHPARKNIGGLPLQETSSNRPEVDMADGMKHTGTPRSRESSVGSETDSYTRKPSTGSGKTTEAHNNFTPNWMRQGRSPSSGAVTGMTSLSPAKSCPSLATDEVPQWKKELAQRRMSKKDSPCSEEQDLESEEVEEIPKKEETKEPEWKRNIQLRKVQTRSASSSKENSSEPEWMKKAEEKRARLRSKSLQYNHLNLNLK